MTRKSRYVLSSLLGICDLAVIWTVVSGWHTMAVEQQIRMVLFVLAITHLAFVLRFSQWASLW